MKIEWVKPHCTMKVLDIGGKFSEAGYILKGHNVCKLYGKY